jgi:hypothetical protein
MSTQTFTPEIVELRSMVAVCVTETTPPRIHFCHPTRHARASGVLVGVLRFVCFLTIAALTATTHGHAATIPQKAVVSDRNGVPVLTISDIKMFRRSTPAFQGVVKNVSGAGLTLDNLSGTVHKTDGSTVQFTFGVCDVRWCEFLRT